MDDLQYVYATAGVMALYFAWQVATKRFDPFAPVWMFFVGYVQVYVIQPISYREWAVATRGEELVQWANLRALLALIWFLMVYHAGFGRLLARRLPASPRGWSVGTVTALSPILVVWGLYCAGIFGGGSAQEEMSPEGALLRSFPFVMMVAAVLLMTTGRRLDAPRPAYFHAGLALGGLYVLIWMFNGKRSHSLIGVLSTIASIYITRLKRPSWGVLGTTAFLGALVVALAIGWRNNQNYERSFSGFAEYASEFDLAQILVSMDIAEEEPDQGASYETKEYGGYLLMLDTVPEKSDYDYGASYLRIFSTYIPRIIWPSKPLYGRQQWIDAWVAGSEFPREDDFTGPAIGILGAAQLNGGLIGTIIVLAGAAIFLRTLYDYFLLYADTPWAQFFWSIFFFNAWFMVVTDDPLIWFYYNWAFSVFPIVVLTWSVSKFFARPEAEAGSNEPHDPSEPYEPHAEFEAHVRAARGPRFATERIPS
ncbi:O-antigen polysaccharide polymerase Wzy [Planctomyces sp. SH-PL62]|uniref:O-antigen polysaccharide polymerase Wzy n=1 Tax=Planctomyces sp. SH-PL62 TaxID=1636152 RepID=UPI00078B91FB|nr:O-antigen polysaccharide polymerase Wzy [Planctomyces sp. SH-PL62]AMV35801.1 hypothetical protein VT85_00055 [Planctomyces sp. SH-PL62]